MRGLKMRIIEKTGIRRFGAARLRQGAINERSGLKIFCDYRCSKRVLLAFLRLDLAARAY